MVASGLEDFGFQGAMRWLFESGFGQLGRGDFAEFFDQSLIKRADFAMMMPRVGAKQGVTEIGIFRPIPVNTIQYPTGIRATHSIQAQQGSQLGCDRLRDTGIKSFQRIDCFLQNRGGNDEIDLAVSAARNSSVAAADCAGSSPVK